MSTLVMDFQGRVLIFSITGCPFCKRSKAFLNDLKIPYVDVNLDKYPQRRHEMQERTGRRTVPQIFFNAHHIGGFDDLRKLNEDNKLSDLVKEVAENECPSDAPLPPPDMNEQENDQEEIILLPSQRSNSLDGCHNCTPDELAALCLEIQEKTPLIKNRTYHLIVYKNSFIGRELVDWLVAEKGMTRLDSTQLGKELIRRHFIHHVTYEHDFEDEFLYYRFLGDIKTRALNGLLSNNCLPRKANEVADDLRKLILEIHSDFLSPDGYSVDYMGISSSRKFEEYIRATAELKRVDLSCLSRNEKVSFFCNIYNALVIHAFVVQGPPTNILRRLLFFYHVSYIVGGQEFSLNDIESGVLRANRKPVGGFKRPFARGDSRLQISLDAPEPRIHFALVCGAKSCPPISAYSSENLDEELTVATEGFFEGDNLIIDVKRRIVSLSMILKWYKVDFGRNDTEVLEWVHDHIAPDNPRKGDLRSLIDNGNFKIKYLHYNWDLNSDHSTARM